ncbi:MAG: hypothetical protein IJX25_02315 [Clostridia bacterium]|nr:hypothetical protein [Clostridia bacterium]
MCGIYGCIGAKAVEKTMEGIKGLEYRGYDSAGIAFISEKLNLEKIDKNGLKT